MCLENGFLERTSFFMLLLSKRIGNPKAFVVLVHQILKLGSRVHVAQIWI